MTQNVLIVTIDNDIRLFDQIGDHIIMSKYKIAKDIGRLIAEVELLKKHICHCGCNSPSKKARSSNLVNVDPNATNSYVLHLPAGKRLAISLKWSGHWEKRLKVRGSDYYVDSGQYAPHGSMSQYIDPSNADREYTLWGIFKACDPRGENCEDNHGWNDAIVRVVSESVSEVILTWSVLPNDPAQREMEARCIIY